MNEDSLFELFEGFTRVKLKCPLFWFWYGNGFKLGFFLLLWRENIRIFPLDCLTLIMTGLFLHVSRRKVIDFMFLELVEIVHEGPFVYEGEQLRLNLISSFAFGCNGGYIIAIIISENHVISVDIETFGNRNIFLLFLDDFLVLFAHCSHFIVTKLIISQIVQILIVFLG